MPPSHVLRFTFYLALLARIFAEKLPAEYGAPLASACYSDSCQDPTAL